MPTEGHDSYEDSERLRKKRKSRERQDDVAEIGPPPITVLAEDDC